MNRCKIDAVKTMTMLNMNFYLYISKLVYSYIMLNNLPRISIWTLMFEGSGSFACVKTMYVLNGIFLHVIGSQNISTSSVFSLGRCISCAYRILKQLLKFYRSEINLIRCTKSSLQVACKLVCLRIETAFAH